MAHKIISLLLLLVFITGCVPSQKVPVTSSISLQGQTSVPADQPADISAPTFKLSSPDLPVDGRLPVEYTCDGAGSTLALTWSGAPAETKSFAIIMHHIAAPDDIHWYWVLYNIPAAVTSLPKT